MRAKNPHLNLVVIQGQIATDIEFEIDKKPFARFAIMNRQSFRRGGGWGFNVGFYYVHAYGKVAEFVYAKYVKGMEVQVQGVLRQTEYRANKKSWSYVCIAASRVEPLCIYPDELDFEHMIERNVWEKGELMAPAHRKLKDRIAKKRLELEAQGVNIIDFECESETSDGVEHLDTPMPKRKPQPLYNPDKPELPKNPNAPSVRPPRGAKWPKKEPDKPKRKPGRPKKNPDAPPKPKRPVGRPRKNPDEPPKPKPKPRPRRVKRVKRKEVQDEPTTNPVEEAEGKSECGTVCPAENPVDGTPPL